MRMFDFERPYIASKSMALVNIFLHVLSYYMHKDILEYAPNNLAR